jgi:uncharacterized alkaline shock family protein YloU
MDENIKNDTVDEKTAAGAEEVVEESVKTDTESEEEIEEVGNIKISVDVVSTIAGIAASEIKGVADMHRSFANEIAGKLGAKKNQSKGVKVEMKEDAVIIDLYIVVEYGVRIPELAWEVQESVKNNVETMTGLSVEKVNIHIEGVSFVKDGTNETALVSEEAKEVK